MRYRGIQEYERLKPLSGSQFWSAFLAETDDRSIVELRVFLAPAAHLENLATRWLFLRSKQLSTVRHHGLRKIFDVAESHDPPFVVLEYFGRPSLATQQSTRRLELTDLLRLAFQLATTLTEVHRYGATSGRITLDHVHERSHGVWVLDLTSTEAVPSKELTQALASRDRTPEDDVCSLCQMIQSLLPEAVAAHEKISQHLTTLLRAGQHVDLFCRPSAKALAESFRILCTAAGQLAEDDGLIGSTTVSDKDDGLGITITPDAATVNPETPVPNRLGRFLIHEQLGRGAVGTVFRATDLTNDSCVAVKVLHAQLAQNPVAVRRFSKEARLLSRSESPYIANLLDSNSDQGFHFLAMEYVSGGSLKTWAPDGQRLPEATVLRLILDAAKGLAVAHHHGIFHRDIKPDNILLTAAGRSFLQASQATSGTRPDPETLAKLTDFGLARIDSQSESLAVTQDGAIIGTPLYMSPEQCRGQASDARSDIYSLGATMFHLLSGRPPFQGESFIAVMNAHCNERLPSLAKLCPEISDACVALVEKCLARNPDARYPDVRSLEEDLERLLHGEATSMQVHPAAPSAGPGQIIEFHFSCDLAASPSQLWPYVSNTDRVNYAMGLGSVTYSTRTDPVRGVERFAETRVAGQRLVWQEHPYEWMEGRRLSVLREFSVGPFLWFMNIVDLSPSAGGGTRLTQTFRVVPRNWLGRVLAKLELGRRIPNSFRKVYAQVDRYLMQPQSTVGSNPFGATAAITRTGRTILRNRLTKLTEHRMEPRVVETLGQFLERASDQEVARIRPIVFAERFQLPSSDVIDACLLGAKEGLLTLLWDILCPSCRIPADVQETLASLKDHAYCPACDLRYEVDFANSIELIFRAHPEVRSAETRTYCIGGPAFSAHVVAQVRLAPGERFQLELNLSEGTYQVRGPQLPFAINLQVSAGNGMTRLELPLLRPPVANSIPVLRQGDVVISLLNNTSTERQIRLERSAGRSHALTAAAAAALPLFRELFPTEVLSPGQIVSVTNVTLLMVDLCGASQLYRDLGDGPAFGKIRSQLQLLDDAIRASGGAVVKLVGEGMVAAFSNAAAGMKAACQILASPGESSLPFRLALHRGPAMVTTINDRLDYFGEAVHLTRSMLQYCEPQTLISSAALLDQEDLHSMLKETGIVRSTVEQVFENSAIVMCCCRIPPRPSSSPVNTAG